jgi:hypothetical protein
MRRAAWLVVLLVLSVLGCASARGSYAWVRSCELVRPRGRPWDVCPLVSCLVDPVTGALSRCL